MASSVSPIPIPDAEPAAPRAGRSSRKAQLDEQKRSFLRMVSHELRTPLNSIIGFSEILSKELCGPLGAPQYQAYAEHVRQSGLKLLRLVNQVLEIARLDGHVVDLDMSAEALDHALDDALAGLHEEIAARELSVDIQGAAPPVLADPRGLRTVLGNLLQNAVVFSPQGGAVAVRVFVASDHVDVAISDQGEGVHADDIDRLLRPFEQGGNTLTRPSGGAGLGLPIADLYCRAMGGALKLQGEPGRGLTALVRLRRA